jgi:predicted nuclease of predicted toxin-antitoxin system
VNVKLLLDENLSPWVAETLREAGLDAVHVRERDLLGAQDDTVGVSILQGERDLVNRVLRIWADGHGVFEEIPAPSTVNSPA